MTHGKRSCRCEPPSQASALPTSYEDRFRAGGAFTLNEATIDVSGVRHMTPGLHGFVTGMIGPGLLNGNFSLRYAAFVDLFFQQEDPAHKTTAQKIQEWKDRWKNLSDAERQALLEKWQKLANDWAVWLQKISRPFKMLKDIEIKIDFTLGAQGHTLLSGDKIIITINPWAFKTPESAWDAVRTLAHEAYHVSTVRRLDADVYVANMMKTLEGLTDEDKKKLIEKYRQDFIKKWLEDEADAYRGQWEFDEWLKKNMDSLKADKDNPIPTGEGYTPGSKPETPEDQKKDKVIEWLKSKNEAKRAEDAFNGALDRATKKEEKKEFHLPPGFGPEQIMMFAPTREPSVLTAQPWESLIARVAPIVPGIPFRPPVRTPAPITPQTWQQSLQVQLPKPPGTPSGGQA